VNIRQEQVAAWVLRWTVGLVVLWESYQFGFSEAATRHLQRMGLPQWVAPVLAGAEIVAAILFLVPKLGRIGGYSLLVVFAVAATLHVLHGQFEIGPLLVYGAAVFVCVSANERTVPRSAS
jgi:uncharacterized membrane protein YphA (DoxX/SURF4 family)